MTMYGRLRAGLLVLGSDLTAPHGGSGCGRPPQCSPGVRAGQQPPVAWGGRSRLRGLTWGVLRQVSLPVQLQHGSGARNATRIYVDYCLAVVHIEVPRVYIDDQALIFTHGTFTLR